MQPQLKRIAMLLFDGCDLLDFAGPTGVFHSAARHLIRTAQASELLYVVEPLSIDGGGVRTLQNVIVETNPAPELSGGEFDTIMVTGGLIDHLTCDPRLLDWLKRNHGKVRRVASVCCGAFILAGAGLLEGRRATTHWEDSAHLQESFAGTDVRPDSIYVQDGNVWTSAGITSGIDMALAMIEEDYGHALALLVARNLVVFIKRPGGQSQFSAPLQSQTIEGPLSAVLGWIVDNPCEDLRTERLAERANMSLRNCDRDVTGGLGRNGADGDRQALPRARLRKGRAGRLQGRLHQLRTDAESVFAKDPDKPQAVSRALRPTPPRRGSRWRRCLPLWVDDGAF
jgi:transcriptional regulator GlxA family with amidase domain